MIYTIYGRPKVGKTTLALQDAPKGKTAIISADRGLMGIDTSGFTVLEDTSSKAINTQVLNSKFLSKHKRIVIDTATSLYGDFLREISSGKAPSLNQRGVANNGFATLIRELRNEPSIETVITCQEKMILPTEDWQSDDDDEEVTANVTVDLPAGPMGILTQLSDVIGRLYIAYVNEKPVRRLWLTPTPSIVAGARSHKYQGKPPYLARPSVGRLNQLLGWNN